MRATLLATLTCAGVVALPIRVSGQEAHLEILRQKFQDRIEAIADDFDGVAGIHVIDLQSGERFGVNEDLVFPQGSAIKIPILLELFRRAEHEPGFLRRRREVTDAVRTGGSGVLQYLTDGGSALSLEDYAITMILYSDNTATNVLIDEVGMDSVNALMDRLGAPHTRLRRKMIRPEASAAGRENVSTPREAADLMARIAGCDLPLGAPACRRVIDILELYKRGPVRAPIPRSVKVAFKPGGIEGVATAWALVELPDRPYVLTVMTNYGGDGGAVVRAASAAAYRYFTKLARSTPYGARVPLAVKRRASGNPSPRTRP